jgi:hypothetical protein
MRESRRTRLDSHLEQIGRTANISQYVELIFVVTRLFCCCDGSRIIGWISIQSYPFKLNACRAAVNSGNSDNRLADACGGAVRSGAVRCGAVRCGAARCGAVRYGTVRCGAVRYGTVRYGAVLSMPIVKHKPEMIQNKEKWN